MPPPIGPIRDIISLPAATLNQGKEIIIHCRPAGLAGLSLVSLLTSQNRNTANVPGTGCS